MTHAACCPALALFILGQHEMARIAAALCEWGRLQAMFDAPDDGPLFDGGR